MADSRGEDIFITLKILRMFGKATKGLCDVVRNRGFLGNDETLRHALRFRKIGSRIRGRHHSDHRGAHMIDGELTHKQANNFFIGV
jgi:hypothetical protein